jgi:tripartite-type tricarboxylate transporter receptor subunit TctC
MKLPRRAFLHLASSAAALSTLVHVAWAQDWPTRPVTMVVPYAAGGPLDTGGRIVAPVLSERLGQQVIVENVVGAGGMTGAARVAKAAPDGYQCDPCSKPKPLQEADVQSRNRFLPRDCDL